MTTEISTSMIRELRDKTGAGIMDAKRALEQSRGDMKKAEEALREKGLASAAKRSGRATSEGVIEAYIHSGGRIGAMVELNCETDFVARTDDFKALARNLAMQVAAMSPLYLDRESVPANAGNVADEQLLVEQDYIRDPGTKIGDLVKQLSAKTGENVKIGRFQRFELGQ
jgi:elongation factor Ts